MDEMHPSQMARTVTSFLVMDVMERANILASEGRDIIHLEVGEPDFDTPDCIRKAAYEAMQHGRTHYTDSLGIPELRHAIAAHYGKTYGVQVDESRIMVTAGSSPALLMAIACLVDAGDEIIMSDPYYACYPNFTRILKAVPHLVPTGSADGFQLDPSKVRDCMSEASKAVLINSPANPTGICLDAEHMKALGSLGIPIISDEIYHGLVYESEQHTILEFTDNAVVINGFSKAYAMTGFRVGYVSAPPELSEALLKVHQYSTACASSLSQAAALEALTGPQESVGEMVAEFQKRRNLVVSRLNHMGLECNMPQGAFYVFPQVRDPDLFVAEALKRGVVLVPGASFGGHGAGHFRLSYAASYPDLEESMDRLESLVKSFL
ncbi:MAG: pyridoxal phosphate-dependent aminotransferase [Deltaproteobacteria bacterium]|nr:pyridoxal phosphate-dependent aminotransferase [Deltaproteobacteria bacterium]